MALTILSIPFLIIGVMLNPYTQGTQRCVAVKAGAANAYCFEQGSTMPETIKYGSVAIGFGLLYAGRRQIKRRREGK